MNLILAIIDTVAEFVKRNPIFCLVVLILAIGAPSLLAGIASVVLYIIITLVVVMLIVSLVLRWKLARLADNFDSRRPGDGGRQREGDVKIHVNTDSAQKRISDDVGDYVEFEEEKNN